LTATGSGEREIFVSYISEVPVWKSTYRILMPDKPNDKPLLQGWAVVDNTIGEDWQDVELTLVAGAPQSFVQNISQPYYVRRPEVALPESAQLTPQTHEAAFDRLEQYAKLQPGVVGAGSPGVMTGLQGFVRDSSGAVIPNARVTVRNEETGSSQNTTTNSQGMYRFDNIPAGNSALFVDAPGFRRFQLTSFYLGTDRMNEIDARLEVGSTSEAVTVSASTPTVETQSTTLSSAPKLCRRRRTASRSPGTRRQFRVQAQAEDHYRQKPVGAGTHSPVKDRSGKSNPLDSRDRECSTRSLDQEHQRSHPRWRFLQSH